MIVEEANVGNTENRNEVALENYHKVVDDFFTDFGLLEAKRALWEMVEVCLTSENLAFQKAEDRENLVYRYKHLNELLTASYQISEAKSSANKEVM